MMLQPQRKEAPVLEFWIIVGVVGTALWWVIVWVVIATAIGRVRDEIRQEARYLKREQKELFDRLARLEDYFYSPRS